MFPVTRADALDRLHAFVPEAGSAYAKKRNYDYGTGYHDAVSRLSAALRRRTITEEEVIAEVLAHHPFARAEKFIQEVYWRTYWKGWLEMRPSLWHDYVSVTQSGFRDSERLDAALAGKTGIACFDAWHAELITTNYLHNHARMWFASIWIHTFNLPWQAGAHLFMTHLKDGCPASNTLGWRWVAGLQTRGKAYAARADNIDSFTNGRFAPYGELQEDVAAIAGPENPPASVIAEPRLATGHKPLLLITPEDCHPETLAMITPPVAVASLPTSFGGAHRAPAVQQADSDGVSDACARAETHYQIDHHKSDLNKETLADQMADLLDRTGADHFVMAYQPVGYWADALRGIQLPINEVRRSYDDMCWPHAKKGFFPFKEKIPQFLRR